MAKWDSSKPYNDLPALPPAADLETRQVLKAAIEARSALAALNQAAQSIPNPTVLINSISILEAQASSEIENIVTTTDDLFKYAQDENGASNPAIREALRYRTALYEGFNRVTERPLNTSTALEICSIVKMHEMHVRKFPGTFIGSPVTHEAIYTPPVGEALILDKLANWEEFIHAQDNLDPLIRMAVAHYQFEAIHPFEDGNGRTGRILNVLILVEADLLSQPILYLSRYVIRNRSDYYGLLQSVTAHGAWEPWILYMLEGIRQSALFTLRKIAAIRDLQAEFHEVLRDSLTSGVNADLLAILFEQPYCRITNVMERCGVSRPTATNWLKTLADRGVLLNLKAGRERLFVNTQFLALLTRDEDIQEKPALEPVLF